MGVEIDYLDSITFVLAIKSCNERLSFLNIANFLFVCYYYIKFLLFFKHFCKIQLFLLFFNQSLNKKYLQPTVYFV